MNWKATNKKNVISTPIFALEELELHDVAKNRPLSHPFYRLTSADWVNILPITADNEAILIRQPRAGNLQVTLEIPGGIIDRGEDPAKAALRELEEETGYHAESIELLTSMSPNPALFDNTLHMFLAKNATVADSRSRFPDENESIETIKIPLDQLALMVYRGEINSALASLTIMLALSKPK